MNDPLEGLIMLSSGKFGGISSEMMKGTLSKCDVKGETFLVPFVKRYPFGMKELSFFGG